MKVWAQLHDGWYLVRVIERTPRGRFLVERNGHCGVLAAHVLCIRGGRHA